MDALDKHLHAQARAIGEQDRRDAQDRVTQLEEALRGLLNASTPYGKEGSEHLLGAEDEAWDLAWYQASRTLNNFSKEGE